MAFEKKSSFVPAVTLLQDVALPGVTLFSTSLSFPFSDPRFATNDKSRSKGKFNIQIAIPRSWPEAMRIADSLISAGIKDFGGDNLFTAVKFTPWKPFEGDYADRVEDFHKYSVRASRSDLDGFPLFYRKGKQELLRRGDEIAPNQEVIVIGDLLRKEAPAGRLYQFLLKAVHDTGNVHPIAANQGGVDLNSLDEAAYERHLQKMQERQASIAAPTETDISSLTALMRAGTPVQEAPVATAGGML